VRSTCSCAGETGMEWNSRLRADRQVSAAPTARGSRLARILELTCRMNRLAWLGLAVIISAVAAVTGLKPKGTRHVAHTSLMGMARLALIVIFLILAYPAFRARSGV